MNKCQELKVVLLGDSGVGKSSITLRFVNGVFDDGIEVTLGATFVAKALKRNGITTRLQIWDTAGQEIYRSIVPMFYRDAQMAILVYDITKKESFENLSYWIEELKTKAPPDITIVGNKIDLTEKEEVSLEEGINFAKQYGAIFKLTSAKEGKGIQELFEIAADKIEQKLNPPEQKNGGNIKLDDHGNPIEGKKCC